MTSQESNRLFLIDAYSLIYRAYYAFIRNPRYNSKGLNTSAAYGFINSLVEVINKENPSHLAVCFDTDQPTFRNNLYKDYKANREEMPEDIRTAIPYIRRAVQAFNIPLIEKDGYEADDVVGTLSKQAEENGFETYMMTPDKDYAQLVDEQTFIYKPKGSGTDAEIIGKKDILEKYGIHDPLQVIDILALWGDTSDNIPGVPGVGEKTAIKLIGRYGSVEQLIAHAGELKGKLKDKIIHHQDQIYLSKQLVTIIHNVPVQFNPDELKIKSFNKSELQELLDELEFQSIKRRLFEEPSSSPSSNIQQQFLWADDTDTTSSAPTYDSLETVDHNYYLVDTKEGRQQLVQNLCDQAGVAFDTETTSLYVYSAELIGISFSYQKRQAYYVPIPRDKVEAKKVLNEFQTFFTDERITKIGQNVKFDLLMLELYGIEVKGKVFDTMIAHYLIQPELRHNLDYLAEQYLNYQPIPTESLIGKKGKHQMNMGELAPEQIYEYACEDADVTLQLKEHLEAELSKYHMQALAEAIEMPLIYVLKKMELYGVALDVKQISQFGEQLKKELSDLKQEITELAGGIEFNIDSPKQLGEVLFEKMKISNNPPKTKTQQYSTSEETLEKLRDKHEIVGKILEYRSVRKMISGYVEALPKLINQNTRKIHTSFNQTITSTGRLSSNNPNLQNIPIREERGRTIRKAFVSSDSYHVILAADYSQIELRIMAHMSGDPQFIAAFQGNQDIHTVTASKVFNVPEAQVDNDMRRKAKTANFGIIYGISAYGLSQRLNISRNEAKELINSYFNSYPVVKEYMNKCIQFAQDHGYVQTLMGRRRYVKDINSNNSVVRGIAERTAINAPIQGTASDIIKKAMIRIDEELSTYGYQSKMILQVHDELVFDALRSEVEELRSHVKTIMEEVISLQVPLLVETGIGNNWLEAH